MQALEIPSEAPSSVEAAAPAETGKALPTIPSEHPVQVVDDAFQMRKLTQLRKLTNLTAADFEILTLLGLGDAGRVYLVRRSSKDVIIPTARGEYVFALKVCSQHDLRKRNKTHRFLTERDILIASSHPYIMTLHATFADERNYYLLMEYCNGGEFSTVLKSQPKKFLAEEIVRFYASELVSALEFLHFHGIIYRDLKTENVLLHSDGHIRLTDFDLAKRLQITNIIEKFRIVDATTMGADKGRQVGGKRTRKGDVLFSTAFDDKTSSLVGTPECLSPDVIRGDHSQAADWWTLGIFIYEALYGFTPFYSKGATFEIISRKILRGFFTFPESDNKVSKHAKDLIKKLLVSNPAERLGSKAGASEIKNHPFFRSVNFAFSGVPPFIPNIIRAPPITKEDVDGIISSDSPILKKIINNFTKFSEEFKQMSKDFAGCAFKLPAGCTPYLAPVMRAYEKAGLPKHPKHIDIYAEEIARIRKANQSFNPAGYSTITGAASRITVDPLDGPGPQAANILFSNDAAGPKTAATVQASDLEARRIQEKVLLHVGVIPGEIENSEKDPGHAKSLMGIFKAEDQTDSRSNHEDTSSTKTSNASQAPEKGKTASRLAAMFTPPTAAEQPRIVEEEGGTSDF